MATLVTEEFQTVTETIRPSRKIHVFFLDYCLDKRGIQILDFMRKECDCNLCETECQKGNNYKTAYVL